MLRALAGRLHPKLARRVDQLAARVASRRRIFVASWRQGQNYGDDYLAEAVERFLRPRCADLPIVQTNLHLDNYGLTANDILVLAGGGLWGPSGSGRLEQALYDAWVNTPAHLVVANIGIESFDPAAAPQLAALRKKAELFSVRDQESWRIAAEVLGPQGALWTADSTYLAPLRISRSPAPGCVAVNLCGPEQENFRRPYSVEPIIAAISRLRDQGCLLKGSVFRYAPSQSNYTLCRQIDPACSPTFSPEPFGQCELFIGMHFHSVLLALQNEIPVLALSYSDKVRRLMDEYGLAACCLDPGDPDIGDKISHQLQSMRADQETLSARIRQGNSAARDRLRAFETQVERILGDPQGAAGAGKLRKGRT